MHSSASGIWDEAPCATEQTPDTDSASENYDSTGLPVDLPAEFLIGVQENEAQDPVDRMLAVQKLFELVHEKGKALHRLEQKRQECSKSKVEDSANAAAQLAAEKASFTASLVELKRLASDMGEKYHAQMLEALHSTLLLYSTLLYCSTRLYSTALLYSTLLYCSTLLYSTALLYSTPTALLYC